MDNDKKKLKQSTKELILPKLIVIYRNQSHKTFILKQVYIYLSFWLQINATDVSTATLEYATKILLNQKNMCQIHLQVSFYEGKIIIHIIDHILAILTMLLLLAFSALDQIFFYHMLFEYDFKVTALQ